MSEATIVVIDQQKENPNVKKIFMVSVVKEGYEPYPKDEKDGVLFSPKRIRCWGWYSEFADAEKAILENHTDMFEVNYYNLALIETVEEGVGAIADQVQWYRAEYLDKNSNDPTVTKMDPPKGNRSCNFCFG